MKKPTSVYIDTTLVLAMNSRGIEISPFINRAMALFLDVPEDPNDELIKRKTESVVSTLLLSYEKELQKKVRNFEQKTAQEDHQLAADQDLQKFGQLLIKTRHFSKFKTCLSKKELNDDILHLVTKEINSLNGRSYEDMELWNRSIDWYQKYGKATA